jgi:hypothetical protein
MKTIITLTLMIMMTACAYNPVVDTAGRSGTYDADKAKEITNDIQHCQQLADEHTDRLIDSWSQGINLYASVATLGIIPRKESTYRQRVQRCLAGRGHSVIK